MRDTRRMFVRKVIIICLMIMVIMTGCSDKKDNNVITENFSSEENSSKDNNQEEDEPIYPAIEPDFELDSIGYRLRTDESEEYRDVNLKLGEKIDLINRHGYTFGGYQDENKVLYIDKTGTLILEYNGTKDFVVLWPIFEAKEYEVIICKDNQPLTEFNKIRCKFDSDLKKDLPIGRVLESKDKHIPRKVVIGFTNQNGNTISMKDSKITLKKIDSVEKCINHNNQEVIVNIDTSDLTYIGQNGINRVITNDGYLKQKVDENNHPYDVFDLSPKVKIEELKKLGYKKARIQVSAVITVGKGEPCIQVMNQKVRDKKEFKNNALIQEEGIKEKDLKKDGTYVVNATIPIGKMKDKIYIYYNSDTLINSEWNLSGLTLEVEFIQ